jgi:hypothetical protein
VTTNTPAQRDTGPQIRSRKASGAVAPPFILLEGEEGAGKTWTAVQLSRSPRVGQTYALELGETRVDEYGGLMEGANVEVIEHDGSYHQILEQTLAVKAEAARAKAAGEPPVVLLWDSYTFFWDGLRDWVTERAKGSNSNKAKLAEDPAAEVDVGRHLWNDAESRYSRVTNQLMTFPGIVVVTARGKWVSGTDPRTGQPFRDGRKEYRVESHKSLPFSVGAWLRFTRDGDPQVVACKSGHVGVKYERDSRGQEQNTESISAPRGRDLLDYLIFDVMKYDAARGNSEQLRTFTPGALLDEERVDEAAAENPQRVRRLKSREDARDDQRSGLSPEEMARRDAITALFDLAKAAGVTWQSVVDEWAANHGGQDIRQASDMGALDLLADDLRAKSQAKSQAGVA